MTYNEIADRLGTTRNAVRAIVQRLRLPRCRANDSNKVLVTIDLADIQRRPRVRDHHVMSTRTTPALSPS